MPHDVEWVGFKKRFLASKIPEIPPIDDLTLTHLLSRDSTFDKGKSVSLITRKRRVLEQLGRFENTILSVPEIGWERISATLSTFYCSQFFTIHIHLNN